MSSAVRRHRLSVVLFVVIALSGGGAVPALAQAQSYIAQVEDLPLMPGLAEIEGAGVVFDKPDGRIVEAFAQGDVEWEDVLGFYRKTLPQLGWRAVGTASFQRESETLSLDLLDGGGALIVRFTLVPR